MKTTLAAIALISGFSFSSAFAVETKDPVVTLTASEGTRFDSVVKILDALKIAGVNNVRARTISTAEAKDPSIAFTVNNGTSFASVEKILDACKAAGVNTVSVRTTTNEETAK